MTDFKVPSFRKKDMSDKFYFVGRLKEQILESKTFEGKNGPFDTVSLRVVHERLDAEVVTPRYSFHRIPPGNISPTSSIGQYLNGMAASGTTIDFGGGSLDAANETLQAPVGTVYVLCQYAIGRGFNGKDPDRFCIPLAQVGFGNDWDQDEATRIIREARGISAEEAGKEPEAPVTAAPMAPGPVDPAAAEAAAQGLAAEVAGLTGEEAKTKGIAWVQANRPSIPNANQMLIAITRGDWAELGIDVATA
mgnify:CR=1 FL=1